MVHILKPVVSSSVGFRSTGQPLETSFPVKTDSAWLGPDLLRLEAKGQIFRCSNITDFLMYRLQGVYVSHSIHFLGSSATSPIRPVCGNKCFTYYSSVAFNPIPQLASLGSFRVDASLTNTTHQEQEKSMQQSLRRFCWLEPSISGSEARFLTYLCWPRSLKEHILI